MPVAKYSRDRKTKLYYTYMKTGLYLSNGKPKYKKITAKTIARLDEKVDVYKEAEAFGVEPSKTTVDEWKSQWMMSYKSSCRDTTKRWYEYIYRVYIQPKIGAMRVDGVKEFHLQRILSGLSADYSVKTVNGVRVVLFSLFDSARANRLISVNPAQHLKASGREPKKRRALTMAERAAYLNACKRHPLGEFAAFLYFFGLRKGEALALCGSDLHDDHISVSKQHVFPTNNQPLVSLPKTKAGTRIIFIPDKAREHIDFAQKREGLIFKNAKGEAISFTEASKRWKAFIEFALGPDTDVTEHVLRHNYCTMLFENGVDIVTAQMLMGHENVSTTMGIYTHYNDEIKRKNIESVKGIG